MRYAWEGFPQCVLYSGTAADGGFESLVALPAAPFRVTLLSGCAETQSICFLTPGTMFEGAAQCCQGAAGGAMGSEACVFNGGCQRQCPYGATCP